MSPKYSDNGRSPRAKLHGFGAVAQSDGAAGASGGGVAVVRDMQGDVTVNVRGENVRDKELAYLDGLLKRYAHWEDHHTPLTGIAEVRNAVEDGPRLDLPMPFIPRGFKKLVGHDYGSWVEVRWGAVDDLRIVVHERRHVILLGDPGSGKTTSLWRMAHDYATAARDDAEEPLPVFVPLGGYTEDESFETYLGRHLGPLVPYLDTYCASERLVLLLDGLNEMPKEGYSKRVGRIQQALDRWDTQGDIVVVACRPLDYVVKLEKLPRIDLAPLDVERIRTFLCNYLGDATGDRLFWRMAGDEVRELWDAWRGAKGTWDAFWTAEKMPDPPGWRRASTRSDLWRQLREELPPLLEMGRNPYLLLMTAQVYAIAGGRLPRTRVQIFRALVDTLLEKEEKRHLKGWIAIDRQKEALSALAYAMQADRRQGTAVEREWAEDLLRQAMPGCEPEKILHLATSANLLSIDEGTVRFYHRLLQDYFAAREMEQRTRASEALTRYWSLDHWWEPSGWGETVTLMTGMVDDATGLLERLAQVNPVVAGRCLLEVEPEADEGLKRFIASKLLAAMTGGTAPPRVRAQAGQTLAKVGDPRRGVGLREDGLPDIVWCEVLAGPFLMGSADDDGWVPRREEPQHTCEIKHPYAISRYLITNAQYAAFVRAGGYTERHYWTEAGWSWRESESVTGPRENGTPFTLPNHPVVGVSWYESVAFCRWLTDELRRKGELTEVQEIALPTEPQWEKAARGGDGRIYPWGGEPDIEKANCDGTGIGSTSAVGCFPSGASLYGVEDLSGNVWEWCSTEWQGNYERYRPDSLLAGDAQRMVRGGAFGDSVWHLRCAERGRDCPRLRNLDYSIRVVVSPFHRT